MNELSVTRFIAAPTPRVWDVMTNRVTEWWCPKPWRAEFHRLERKPGGVSNCTMYGPEGEVHPNPGMVLAWDEGHRFAFTDAIVGDLEPAGPFMIGIWTVEPEGAGTRYTTGAKRRQSNTPKWGLNKVGVSAPISWLRCARRINERRGRQRPSPIQTQAAPFCGLRRMCCASAGLPPGC